MTSLEIIFVAFMILSLIDLILVNIILNYLLKSIDILDEKILENEQKMVKISSKMSKIIEKIVKLS